MPLTWKYWAPLDTRPSTLYRLVTLIWLRPRIQSSARACRSLLLNYVSVTHSRFPANILGHISGGWAAPVAPSHKKIIFAASGDLNALFRCDASRGGPKFSYREIVTFTLGPIVPIVSYLYAPIFVFSDHLVYHHTQYPPRTYQTLEAPAP